MTEKAKAPRAHRAARSTRTARKPDPRIVGVVLAGGLARRMGGGDKGLKSMAGRPMLAHVIEAVRPQVEDLVLNANGPPGRLASFGLPIEADPIEGYLGPLAGVLAGMRWAQRHPQQPTLVLSVATDAPFLPADLCERLARGLQREHADIALAASRGETHPVIGLWPVKLADALEAALKAGTRKVLAFTDRYKRIAVDFPDLEIGGRKLDPFTNANTEEELAEAERLIGWTGPKAKTYPLGRPVVGIAGFKNSGKTTLAERLIGELARRGHRVASVKHAHHAFDIDTGKADSARHRRAGAREVAIVSQRRFAVVRELMGEPEPALGDVVQGLAPCDLAVVEGYKGAPIPKIEVRRTGQAPGPVLATDDPNVIAIAADHAVEAPSTVPRFALDDIEALADLIEKTVL